jgi:hypothetical protein
MNIMTPVIPYPNTVLNSKLKKPRYGIQREKATDPDPYSESGFRRAKMTHKSIKKIRNFLF